MRFWSALLVVSLLATGPVTPARGAASVQTRTISGGAQVVVNGQPALSLRTSSGGYDAAQRAGIAAKRISDMVAQKQPASKIRVKAHGGMVSVVWGHQTIANATAAEAKAQGSAPHSLASLWAERLRAQLSLPPLKLVQRDLTVPVGETRKSQIIGYSTGPFTVTAEPAGVATPTVEASGTLVVQGVRPGVALVRVSSPDGTDQISVTVAKYAGRLVTASIPAEVSGKSVPADVVAEAAWRAARVTCALEPGARADVTLAAKPTAMSDSRTRQTVAAIVKMSGAGYLDARVPTTVEVIRTAAPTMPAKMLFYSNNPERVLHPQPLYAAPLTPNESARLLYHHQNGSGQKMRVSIMLVNTSSEVAKIHTIGALADPRQDPVVVGYRAGAQFLQDLHNGVGYDVFLPPKSRSILWTGILDKMETASGILQMRQMLGGNGVLVRVLSEPAGITRTAQDITPAEASDYSLSFSAHQYPRPVRELSEEYVAGDRWLFIRVGKHAIPDARESQKLDGNYGVIYKIDLTISNPTPHVKNVQVMFDPTAGVAGVASMIDGQFHGKSHVVGTRELPLAKYTLNPGEQRKVHMSTVPLAGSNYPATIVVRS
ncbi:MAG: hypothetical protein IT209_13060 [Armatimonadetes bacterium]|nr:hypothetical protein [Armatimonadota bacterium]